MESPVAGTVKRIYATVKDKLEPGDLVVEIEP